MIGMTYDPEADALSLRLGPPGVISDRTEEVAPGVLLDFDADGRVIAVEVLDVAERGKALPARELAAE